MQKLDSIDKWEALLQESHTRPVLIFKHTLNSVISTQVQGWLARGETMEVITEPVHILVVQESDELSKAIEETLEVKTNAPQVIVVRNGQAVYHENQERIRPETIEDYILENE